MKPRHEACNEELCTMRYMEYNSKTKKTAFKVPVDDTTETMWCPKCMKPVPVEVMHA